MHENTKPDRCWGNEADEIEARYKEQLLQNPNRQLYEGDFKAMDETMDFQFKPARDLPSMLDLKHETVELALQDIEKGPQSARKDWAELRSGLPAEFMAQVKQDARDHSLKDQGSWVKRWLNAI